MLVFWGGKKKERNFCRESNNTSYQRMIKKILVEDFLNGKVKKVIDPRIHSGIGFSNNASRERESL